MTYATKTPSLENAEATLDPPEQDAEFPTETLIEFYLVVCPNGLPLLERPFGREVQGFFEIHSKVAGKIKVSKSYRYWASGRPWKNHLAQISGKTPC